MVRAAILFTALLLLSACATSGSKTVSNKQLTALEGAMAEHIAVLSSAGHGGRYPGTEGEVATLGYLRGEWQKIGLESGTNDPSHPWFAPVMLTRATPIASLAEFRTKSNRQSGQRGDNTLLLSDETGEAVSVYTFSKRGLLDEAPLLFVGHLGEELGSTALAGRVAVMVWDRPEARAQQKALIENGASAVIAIVPDPRKLEEIRRFYRQGSYLLPYDIGSGAIAAYMPAETAARLFGDTRAAQLLAESAALTKPIPLGILATLEGVSRHDNIETHNLIARLPGRNPKAGAVLITAHWDSLGECKSNGSALNLGRKSSAQIAPKPCPGAVDNASGLAFIIELARLLKRGERLDRDIYFVATTAEEWGLLGARALGQAPPLPLDEVVAAFNVDTVAIAPRGVGVTIIGEGLTGLDKDIDRIAHHMGREVVSNDLSRSLVRRQDSWALLERDVPAVSVSSAYAEPRYYEDYVEQRYHSPDDNAAKVELGGAAQDLILHRELMRHFASNKKWPGAKSHSADKAPCETCNPSSQTDQRPADSDAARELL